MKRTMRAVGLAACATAALLSVGSAAAARPIPYDDAAAHPASVVVREVRVPVDDTRNEVIQIILAAALGTCVAGAVSGIRPRRLHRQAVGQHDGRVNPHRL